MKRLLLISAAFITAVSGVLAEDLNGMQNKASDLQGQMFEAQNNIDDLNEEKAGIESEIDSLDKELDTVQTEIDGLNTRLEEKSGELENANVRLSAAVREKEEQDRALRSRVRTMYERSGTGYLNAVLEADGFSDFFKRASYARYMMNYDKELLVKYEASAKELDIAVGEIEQSKSDIESLMAQANAKKSELDGKIAEKNEKVRQINSSIDTYNAQIEELALQDENVQKLIRQAAGSYAGADSYSSNRVYNPDGKQYQYPIPEYNGYKPNSGYGYRTSPIGGGTEFHTGVDLKATLNTDVIAAESGVVIYAGWRGGYGKCVIIDHGNGYSTLYAHNNELRCHEGQHVERGQVIAGAGTTGYSTGVHSHFEVRIDGKHTNPTSYIY